MSIRDAMHANIDWPWFIASWADKLFSPRFKGCKPIGTERPDKYAAGDYAYAHVAPKYLDTDCGLSKMHAESLQSLLQDLNNIARRWAVAWEIPREFWPEMEDSTLRILEYPVGARIAPHYDFDLFTVNIYRTVREPYKYVEDVDVPSYVHVGELWQEVDSSMTATKHWTEPHYRPQYSVVYFAMPKLSAVLPSGQTVADWLLHRKEQSR